jgi:hypothetical protein
MLFFGYRGFAEADVPEGYPVRAGWYLFSYTLKIGGWVMAAEALWLLSGARAALVCDGVVTVLIGVLLVLGGLLMTPGALWQAILFIIFGLVFISSGLRSWSDARSLTAAPAEAPSEGGVSEMAGGDAAGQGAEQAMPEGSPSDSAEGDQPGDEP